MDAMKYTRHARVWWHFGTRESAERTYFCHTPSARGKTVFNTKKNVVDVPLGGCGTRVRLEIEYDYVVKGNAQYDIKRFAREATKRAETTPIDGPHFEITSRVPVSS